MDRKGKELKREDIEFKWDNSTLVVSNLYIEDPRLLEYIQTKDPDSYPALLTRAIEIGLRVLCEQTSIERIDYVEKAFQTFAHDVEDILKSISENFESYLGSNGKLEQLINDENPKGIPATVIKAVMGDETGLKKLLDPWDEVSPIYRMREELKKQITELRDDIVKKETFDQVYDKTSLKGEDFEKELFDLLNNLTGHFGDIVEHVGKETTVRGKKVGDILVGVRDPLLVDQELIIVIEAKDWQKKSVSGDKGLIAELGEAIANRDADFGIAIAKKCSSLPKYVGSFRFYEPNMIICCAEDPLTVELAYRFGRSVALVRYLSKVSKEVDWENVKNFGSYIENSIKKIDTARKDLGKIRRSVEGVDTILEEYKKDIEEAMRQFWLNIERKAKELDE